MRRALSPFLLASVVLPPLLPGGIWAASPTGGPWVAPPAPGRSLPGPATIAPGTPRPVFTRRHPTPTSGDTLTLAQVVRRALELDPAVAGAEADRAAAEAGVKVARASRFPSLSSIAQGTRFEEPMVVAPIHAFDLSRAPSFDRTLVQGRAELAWTLWDGGARGARIDGARATDAASRAAVGSVRQQSLSGVLEAYLAVLTARDQAAAQAARRQELESERDRVQRFLTEGTAPRVDLLRAEAELSAAAAEESAVRARLELAEATLARLLEVPTDQVAGRPLQDVVPTDPEPPAPDSATLDDHPAVRAARGRLAAARAGVGVARSAWLPRIRASGAFVEYGGGSSSSTGEWQAGLQLEYPLFTGGARSGGVDRAEAEARAAEAGLAGVRRELRQAVDAALTAEREARARAASLTDAVARFEELTRVESLSLEEGVGVQRDFLRAEAGLVQARAGLAEARRAVVLARARLALARGHLTPEWIDRSLEPSS